MLESEAVIESSYFIIGGYLLIPLITVCLLCFTKHYTYLTIGSTILLLVYNILVSPYIHLNQAYELLELSPLIKIILFADDLSLKFTTVVSILWLLANLYALSYMGKHYPNKENYTFFIFFTLAIFATLGIAFSGNLSTTFIFYELLTLFTYPLIVYGRSQEAKKAGNIYLLYLMGGALLLFLPAILLVNYLGDNSNFSLPPNILGTHFQRALVFLLFIYGVTKAAILPMHGWLPKAMVAPTPVSALLHAVAVVKSGAFILIRVIMNVYGLDEGNKPLGIILTYLAAATIIISSVIALKKDALKERLAYSTISQVSYILLAASLFEKNAIQASIVYMMGHAFAKITLFFTAGAINTYTNKKYISEFTGLGKRMPITMVCFSIGALAMIGLPPTILFWAKSAILKSASTVQSIIIIVTLVSSTTLNTYYFLPIIYKSFFGEAPATEYQEADLCLLIPYVITASITLILGLLPLISLPLYYIF